MGFYNVNDSLLDMIKGEMIRVIVYLLCANRDSASSWGISIVKVHLLDTNKGEMIRVIISPDESRGYIGFRSVAPPPPPP